jgi:hypothetical protein
MWEVEGTDEFADWYSGLDNDAQRRVDVAIERLSADGPGLARPWVDTLMGARRKKRSGCMTSTSWNWGRRDCYERTPQVE